MTYKRFSALEVLAIEKVVAEHYHRGGVPACKAAMPGISISDRALRDAAKRMGIFLSDEYLLERNRENQKRMVEVTRQRRTEQTTQEDFSKYKSPSRPSVRESAKEAAKNRKLRIAELRARNQRKVDECLRYGRNPYGSASVGFAGLRGREVIV